MTNPHVDFFVDRLNELNRALPIMGEVRRACTSDNYGPLLIATSAVSMERDRLRQWVSERCGPWFDAQ